MPSCPIKLARRHWQTAPILKMPDRSALFLAAIRDSIIGSATS
jgi:hypothetical protein